MYALCGVPWAQISDVVRDAAARGEVRDINADLASRGFFGMIISQRWQKITAGSEVLPESELALALTNLLLHGILQAHLEPATPVSAADLPETPA